MEFLVIMRMRNPGDPAIQQRRKDVRPTHLKNAARLQNEGHLLIGGAILDGEGNPAGSTAIAQFENREELEAWLRSDPYTQADVWQEFEIIPCQIAPHYKGEH